MHFTGAERGKKVQSGTRGWEGLTSGARKGSAQPGKYTGTAEFLGACSYLGHFPPVRAKPPQPAFAQCKV